MVDCQIQDDHQQQNDRTVNSDDDELSSSFVAFANHTATEQETIHQSVSWPTIDRTAPVNEFRSEGYMSCAFPKLYPTGAADFTAPRLRPVTIGFYFKHLKKFHDGRKISTNSLLLVSVTLPAHLHTVLKQRTVHKCVALDTPCLCRKRPL